MTQDQTIPQIIPEGTFVPDVVCPNCDETIKLDSATYAFYEGQIGCRECHAKCKVRIGAWEKVSGFRELLPRTRPFDDISPGGYLLGPPVLTKSPGDAVQEAMKGISLPALPVGCGDAVQEAISAFGARNYKSAAVQCRVALQAALVGRGIQDATPQKMIADGEERGVLSPIDAQWCQTVVFMGNKGAHPPDTEDSAIGRGDALATAVALSEILGRLYPAERTTGSNASR